MLQPDVRIRISSPDKTWALMLADELEPQVTRLFKVKKFPNWIFFLFAPVVALIGYRISILVGNAMPLPVKHAGWAAACYSALIFFLMAHTTVSEKKFNFLQSFQSEPLFLWGEETAHATGRETFRKNILWVVVIGFLVSLAGGLVPLLV